MRDRGRGDVREKGGRRWRAWGTWVQLRGRVKDVGRKKRKQDVCDVRKKEKY